MTRKTAALRYARALFDVAAKEGANLEQIEQQLSQFAELFTQHPALEAVLVNPAVPAPRKGAAVAAITARVSTPVPQPASRMRIPGRNSRLVRRNARKPCG